MSSYNKQGLNFDDNQNFDESNLNKWINVFLFLAVLCAIILIVYSPKENLPSIIFSGLLSILLVFARYFTSSKKKNSS